MFVCLTKEGHFYVKAYEKKTKNKSDCSLCFVEVSHPFPPTFFSAARMMYERALRLSLEVPGLRSLQQQAQSYLAALNSLYLVQPEYAWIVKPVLRQQRQRLGQIAETDDAESRRSFKHDADGQKKSQQMGRSTAQGGIIDFCVVSFPL